MEIIAYYFRCKHLNSSGKILTMLKVWETTVTVRIKYQVKYGFYFPANWS